MILASQSVCCTGHARAMQCFAMLVASKLVSARHGDTSHTHGASETERRSVSGRVSARQVMACPCMSEHGVAMLNPLFIRKSEQKLGWAGRYGAKRGRAMRGLSLLVAARRCLTHCPSTTVGRSQAHVRPGTAGRGMAGQSVARQCNA